MDFNINDAITEYSSSLNDLGIVFDSNNRDTESEKSFIDYSDKPILPQSFSNLTNEDIDNTVTTLDQAKYASYKKIDKNNFFESTACNWKQVNDKLEKDPDYTSDSGSKYWYTDKGVYRLSDHWGFGVGSCDWLLNEDPELSWRDESGKRLGYADFSEFKDTSNNSFPEIFEILTEKDANIGDKDQGSLVTYYNYRSDKDELPTDFMQDTVYNAPIETQIYSNSAEDSTQSINVVDKVTENVVDSITEKVNPQVSGQGGSPKTYTNKKPGETTLKNYAFEVSTIDKIAEESTAYFFDVIYSLGLENEYKNYLDGVEVTSGFKFVKISDFIQDFNRQDELTDDQLNRFLNRLPITEVNKDEKEKLKEDAKKVNKVITNIPKNLNAPFLEDEMGTNVLFYGDMDWMEMSDLSEM